MDARWWCGNTVMAGACPATAPRPPFCPPPPRSSAAPGLHAVSAVGGWWSSRRHDYIAAHVYVSVYWWPSSGCSSTPAFPQFPHILALNKHSTLGLRCRYELLKNSARAVVERHLGPSRSSITDPHHHNRRSRLPPIHARLCGGEQDVTIRCVGGGCEVGGKVLWGCSWRWAMVSVWGRGVRNSSRT